MIKCPECGRDVSDLAPQCPGCGRPLSRNVPEKTAKKFPVKLLIVIGAVVAVAVIALVLLLNPAGSIEALKMPYGIDPEEGFHRARAQMVKAGFKQTYSDSDEYNFASSEVLGYETEETFLFDHGTEMLITHKYRDNDDYATFKGLRKELVKKYGEPSGVEDDGEKLIWQNGLVSVELYLSDESWADYPKVYVYYRYGSD